jgi:hypothetical protein
MVLRRIYEPRREEITAGWRKLHNDKLHNISSSPLIIRVIKLRRMRWVGHVGCMSDMRNAYNVLVGKLERKRPLETPR